MCAEESLLLRAVSKGMNRHVLKSKELSYTTLFKRAMEGPVAKYFKILDQVNSLDIFTIFDTLVWAIKNGFVEFFASQIQQRIPQMLRAAQREERIKERFLAFFPSEDTQKFLATHILPVKFLNPDQLATV